MKDLEIYHNMTTSGRCTEDFCGNWYGIGMELVWNWYGILWNSMEFYRPTGITLEWTF